MSTQAIYCRWDIRINKLTSLLAVLFKMYAWLHSSVYIRGSSVYIPSRVSVNWDSGTPAHVQEWRHPTLVNHVCPMPPSTRSKREDISEGLCELRPLGKKVHIVLWSLVSSVLTVLQNRPVCVYWQITKLVVETIKCFGRYDNAHVIILLRI